MFPDYKHQLVGTGIYAVVYSITAPPECVIEVSYQFVEPNLSILEVGGCSDEWILLKEKDGQETKMDKCTPLVAPGTGTSKTSYVDIKTYPDMFDATKLTIQWREKLKPSF